jgi:hypothetical protein
LVLTQALPYETLGAEEQKSNVVQLLAIMFADQIEVKHVFDPETGELLGIFNAEDVPVDSDQAAVFARANAGRSTADDVDSPLFRRKLLEWAEALPETARLGPNPYDGTVELHGVGFEMRRNLRLLAKQTGLAQPEAVEFLVYCKLRSRALQALALNGAPGYFYPLPYERTGWQGMHTKLKECGTDGFFQPLRDALLEYCNQPDVTEHPVSTDPPKDEIATQPGLNSTGSAERAQAATVTPAGAGTISRKRGRPTRFTREQLREAYAMKQAGQGNHAIAQVLYGTKTSTAAQRRSVPTTLRHHFPSK